MAIIDLHTLTPRTEVHADTCVVGAGAAGLLLAAILARRGLSVILLEAGGRACADESATGMQALVENNGYLGTSAGRAFGLGGTTSKWGGQLIPHSELDFRKAETGRFDFWLHLSQVVNKQTQTVYDVLGVHPMCEWFRAESYLPTSIVEALRKRGLEVVTGDWLPFRKRNLSFLAEFGVGGNELSVYLNAPAAEWHFGRNGSDQVRIKSVVAKSAGKSLIVHARQFVLAAGSIESTRILLEMEYSLGKRFRERSALGRYLADHLSCRVANVEEHHWARCAETFGPQFRNGRMRTFRLLDRNGAEGTARGFFHFIFESNDSGFTLARTLLQGLQSRQVPAVCLGEAAKGIGGITALAWSRFIRRRLYISNRTPCHLQLDIEQMANADNRITLSDSTDREGRPKVVVRWAVSEADEERILTTATRFFTLWPEGDGRLPHLQPAIGKGSAPKPHDVYHPVGTCRMGLDDESVVDPELRVYGAENLWLASTAVFPSAGTANPTFSLLCLTAALGDHLAEHADASGCA